MNRIEHGDVLDVLPTLANRSVNLVITSPPYAEQRRGLYGGVHEREYPAWTVRWMDLLRPKLATDASVMINIREHVRDGCISDYVLRTRLALREAGWNEIEELIWFAPDKPPLGSRLRPRRCWERVLWFSQSKRPYVDLFACGNPQNGKAVRSGQTNDRNEYNEQRRLGIRTGGTRWKGDYIHAGQGLKRKNPVARVTDLIRATCGSIDPHVPHPAMFPRALPSFLVQTFSRTGDLVLDPFVGSGTSCLVAEELGRRWMGIDNKREYVRLARRRLRRRRVA